LKKKENFIQNEVIKFDYSFKFKFVL